MGWAALGLVGFLAFVAAGYVIGLAVSTPGEIRAPAPGDPSACADFCLAWERTRSALCIAKSNLAAADAFADQCWNAWMAAVTRAAAFTAASVAAAFIPFLGPAIVTTLASTAATLWAIVVALLAVYLGARAAVTTKRS